MLIKRFVQWVVVAVLLVSSPGWSRAPEPVIAILGDSLSAGYGLEANESWVALLQARLADEGYGYRVVNASITGDTTAGGLNRLPSLLKRESPSLLIVELGGNDGLRGLPVARMEQNLRRMIELSAAAGTRVVLAGIQIPPNYGQVYTEQFKTVFPKLADAYDVSLVEFILDGVALNPEFMQDDGIHPNALGQPQMLNNVWPVVLPLLEALEIAQ